MSTIETKRRANGQESPVTLLEGATPALRRVIAGALVANAAPSLATDGYDSQCAKMLHILAQSRVGTSFAYVLWLYDATSGLWAASTLGTVAVTTAGGPVRKVHQIDQADRVYVQTSAFVGAGNEADVWLAGT